MAATFRAPLAIRRFLVGTSALVTFPLRHGRTDSPTAAIRGANPTGAPTRSVALETNREQTRDLSESSKGMVPFPPQPLPPDLNKGEYPRPDLARTSE